MNNKITILLALLLTTTTLFSSENRLHIKTGDKNNHQYRGMDQKTDLSFLYMNFDSSKNSDFSYQINANEKFSENMIKGEYRVSKSNLSVALNASYHLYSGKSESFNNLRNNLATAVNANYKHSKYIRTFLKNEISYDNYSLGYNGSLGVKLTPSNLISFKTDINWLMYESLSFMPYSVNILSQLYFDATPIVDMMFRASVYVAMFPFIIILEALTGSNSFFDNPATGIVFLNAKFGVSYYFTESNINPEKLAPKLSASLNYNF